MKIIRFIQAGEIVQLGFEGKVLFLKFGQLIQPIRLGELRDIRNMGIKKKIEMQGKEVKTPIIIKKMAQGITFDGLTLADSYTEEEFYNDFLEDYKQMSKEGSIKFIGEFNEWA